MKVRQNKRLSDFVLGARQRRAAAGIAERAARKLAFIEEGAGRKRRIAMAKGEPFLEMGAEEALALVRKHALPEPRPAGHAKGGKRRLLNSLFSPKEGNLGLVVVKPAMIGETGRVRKFLREIGCEIVFSKPLMMDRGIVGRVYPHAIRQHHSFVMHALDLLSGPSRVIVFRHLAPGNYAAHLSGKRRIHAAAFRRMAQATAHPGMASQEAFNLLFKGSLEHPEAGTLRGDIVYPAVRRMGFGKKTARGTAKTADTLGYYRRHLGEPGFKVAHSMTGLHIPNAKELPRDANAFLTAEDLREIKRRA